MGIFFLQFTSSENNQPHQTLHVPSRTIQSFGEVDPHVARLPTDVISNVITAMSTLANVICLRQRH